MNIHEFEFQMNKWAKEKIPFLFVVDFELEQPLICRLNEAEQNGILFDFGHRSNVHPVTRNKPISLVKFPIPYSEYKKKFEVVSGHLQDGDSFLTNLTIRTRIKTDQNLRELFSLAQAKYKILFDDNFLVFSPEAFVRIDEGKIKTFPMKGTIDADLPGAREIILGDPKEMAEHVTIVDLMRNDLSLVAADVKVTRFRYIEEIKTNQKNLLQVSSEIEGVLPADDEDRFGTILIKLLPAGSISGAPKAKTVGIIRDAEVIKRGYYTGVFGYFDGAKLESAVMIRFIEKIGDQLYYRSGGGITTQSDPEREYQEAIDKIYVPVD